MICLGGRVGWTASEDGGGPGSTANSVDRPIGDRKSGVAVGSASDPVLGSGSTAGGTGSALVPDAAGVR